MPGPRCVRMPTSNNFSSAIISPKTQSYSRLSAHLQPNKIWLLTSLKLGVSWWATGGPFLATHQHDQPIAGYGKNLALSPNPRNPKRHNSIIRIFSICVNRFSNNLATTPGSHRKLQLWMKDRHAALIWPTFDHGAGVRLRTGAAGALENGFLPGRPTVTPDTG